MRKLAIVTALLTSTAAWAQPVIEIPLQPPPKRAVEEQAARERNSNNAPAVAVTTVDRIMRERMEKEKAGPATARPDPRPLVIPQSQMTNTTTVRQGGYEARESRLSSERAVRILPSMPGYRPQAGMSRGPVVIKSIQAGRH